MMSTHDSKRRKRTDAEAELLSSEFVQIPKDIVCDRLSRNLRILTFTPSNEPALSVVILGSNVSFLMSGKARLVHLLGTPIHILGASVKADVRATHVLFSPTSHAPITIRQLGTKDSSNAVTKEALQRTISDVLSSVSPTMVDLIWEACTEMEPEVSVLLFLTYACRLTDSVCSVKKFKNLYTIQTDYSSPADAGIVSSLGFSFSLCDSTHGFRVSSEMVQLAEHFVALCTAHYESLSTEAMHSASKPPTLLVAGPKGAGKSSLLRFVINYFLTVGGAQSEIAVLDFDVGQPEFTPSALISLTVVQKPLFGPPFVHQLLGEPKPLCQCFVGCITPSDNPNFYVDCMHYVFGMYQSMPDPKPPLLVNTMGWTQGLGLTLLTEQIILVKPDIVAQLQLNADQPGARQNLPVMDTDSLRSMEGWHLRDLSDQEFNHQVAIIPSLSRSKHQSSVQSNLGAPDHRDLTLLAYFVATLANAPTSLPARGRNDPLGHPVSHFLDCLPYRVPLSCPNPTSSSSDNPDGSAASKLTESAEDDFRLGVCLIQPKSSLFRNPFELLTIDLDALLACLNATLVALCAVPPNLMELTNTTPPCKVIRENPVCKCIGLAICRAIDPSAGLLYLTTGIPDEDLLEVTGILRGFVNLPQCFFLEQPIPIQSDGEPKPVQLPYLGPAETQGPGRISIPSRRSYPRTQHHEFHRTGSSEAYEHS
ncbi:polynucleotide 5'-hydroxyl-kinase nol-9 [Clonorchis sinensis]|uniref:Polynucleotide 5'-hydroxyl-kinase nol-9 n=1 Tax=Clonorchis sinensis TaxID=79923 RepID=G7YNG2_CLOSI|nr:polynucleotide 5'-hydroxyl-kinase nol-9 [Clonorchis sinensis]